MVHGRTFSTLQQVFKLENDSNYQYVEISFSLIEILSNFCEILLMLKIHIFGYVRLRLF